VSDTRFPQLDGPESLPPLFDYAAVKAWFGLTEDTPNVRVTVAMNAVSTAIRNYTGRTITKGAFTETFEDVREDTTCRYLLETPLDLTVPPKVDAGMGEQDLEVFNAKTGRVKIFAGPRVRVSYSAGYDPVPDDLQIVFMELLRLQMAQLGESTFGTATTVTPQEKAVWVGTLKVEYAVSATTEQSKAAAAGGITADALAPWASVLDMYRSRTSLVAT
jgi:hypothetical protein